MPPGALPGGLFHRAHQTPAPTRQRQESDSTTAVIDLSSLEGPPFENLRARGSMDGANTRHLNTPQPTGQYPGYHALYNKPLPPRPASAEPASARRLSPAHAHPRMCGNEVESLPRNTHLPCASAHRNRPGAVAAVRPHRNITSPDLGPSAQVASPLTTRPSHARGLEMMRSQSTPLVWQNTEQVRMNRESSSTRSSLARLTRPPQLEIYMSDSEGDHSSTFNEDGEHDLISPPPPYDSHDFDRDRWDQARFGARVPWDADVRWQHESRRY
ncbi:hypothetical protein PDE_02720 [Penicillium oxalicum 114-2]|uniref:Uncharacterized protein n=1 Tax=Penicillium oxalicum (strain 114-2 / CGMCC 5302) TaxID=933388 RepID=S7ZGK7_PENO1|nr:hypothetical protein PDE_02720 [Penicillium oxalicum 114-2]